VTAARGHRVGGLACVAAMLVAVVASFRYIGADFHGLFEDEGRRAMARFVVDFFPPDVSPDFLRKVGFASLQTLAVSLLGTAIPMVVGGLLALPAAGRFGWPAKWLARALLNGLRSVPGRLFAESLENASPLPESALRDLGAGPVARFAYGTLPLVAAQCLGYTLYRWEMNIRMSTILGFVGGGGLGQLLYFHLSLLQMAQAATVLIAMTLLVLADDALSGWARRALSAQSH